jgi:hypothetical protein
MYRGSEVTETPVAPRADREVWTDRDRQIVSEVEGSLADGVELLQWWRRTDAVNGYDDRFDLIRQFNWSDTSYGFFGRAPLSDGILPVMGVVEESTYDQPKSASPERVRDEFREFVLHFFMRVSAFEEPQAFVKATTPPPEDFRPGVSWCPSARDVRGGFGYAQIYYKLAEGGEVGKFAAHEIFRLADLRDFGPRYAWTICRNRIFDFDLTFQPFGPNGAAFVLPLKEENYLVVSPAFIANREKPRPGILAEYGFGYALLRTADEQTIFAYGPGRFRAGVQLIHFQVLESGEIRVKLVFVVNRPDRILNIPIAPVDWGFRLADLFSLGLASRLLGPARRLLDRPPFRVERFDPVSTYIQAADTLTGGFAASDLCISREQLEKIFLVQHFVQHYRMIVGSLLTWRHIPNWLNISALPNWLEAGWLREI